MTERDILNMMIAKIEQVKDRIDSDYNRGVISNTERAKSLFYLDECRYDIQRTLKSMTVN